MMSMNSIPLAFYLTSLSQNKLKEAHDRARGEKGKRWRIIDIVDIVDGQSAKRLLEGGG
jgi:hypothetical protein